MLVVDASCLYEVLVDAPQSDAVRRRLRADEEQAAPHLIDAEILGVLRRDRALRRLDDTAASQAVVDLRIWPGIRYDHRLLSDRAWELRHNLRTWDGFYVALAEALGATLLTLDRRMAGAPGPECEIEVVG